MTSRWVGALQLAFEEHRKFGGSGGSGGSSVGKSTNISDLTTSENGTTRREPVVPVVLDLDQPRQSSENGTTGTTATSTVVPEPRQTFSQLHQSVAQARTTGTTGTTENPTSIAATVSGVAEWVAGLEH